MKLNGKPVVDVKRKIVLTITPADVTSGRKKTPDSCAAAKACIRQLGATSARVHVSRTYVEFPDKWLRFQTPAALRTEIVSFDRGHRFEAGKYTLAPMSPANIAVGKRQGSKSSAQRGRRGKKRSAPHMVHGVRGHAAGWTTAEA